MSNSLFHVLGISRQNLLARMQELDTASNNLANVNTVGYKSQRSNFQELLKQAEMDGVFQPSSQRITDQGSLKTTGNGLDLGLTGEGYFQIRMPNGQTGYTRDGQFTLDSNLDIVNANGMRLVWDGKIPAEAEEVQVQLDGAVMYRVGSDWMKAGQIPLVRFTNDSALLEVGKNLYQPNKNSGTAQVGTAGTQPFGQIQAGTVEQSNVNTAEEMTRMMILQRDFQITVKAFQQTDTMISQAIQMRRG